MHVTYQNVPKYYGTYWIFRVFSEQLKELYSNLNDIQNKNFRLSNFNNKEKKIITLKGSEINLFLDDISMSGLSKADPFPLLLFHWKFLLFLVLQLLILPFFVVSYFNREKKLDSFPKWIVLVDSWHLFSFKPL